MPKTTFVDGDPSNNILGTILTAAFLNALNNHRHSGANEDGAGALDYADSGGSSNAYTLTLPKALSAHVAGMPIKFKASFTNTGAATINISGLGAITIKKNVSAALVAGDIVSGQIVTVEYDGTNYQLANSGQNVDLSQFLKGSGYQKLPSGLIIQWGDISTSGSGSVSVTFPITFPNAVYEAYATANVNGACFANFYSPTTSGGSIDGWNSIGGARIVLNAKWFAIGY